jgi:DNA primase
MAGRIPQNFIDELIGRADIVELIGERVPLKKSGREFKACCPFHDEKTPSFWVSPDKQFFHCFGCGVHGTALGFLMQYEQLSFPEAVEELAQRLGLEVPREAGMAARSAGTEGLTDILGRVAGFYAEQLEHNQRASVYLRDRGLLPETLQQFRIGYAPDSWHEVLRRFGATEPSRRALLATGLIIERERATTGQDPHYDRFRDRIMFPIRDARGRVIGFGGRVIDRGEPKYLNSPETTLFHKGRELYGLYEVRQTRLPLKRLLIVEGYMDVARLHQAGVHYAVATLGTATTAEHLRRAFRLVSEIVFAFDGDRAGRAAAWRALQNALPEAQEGREIRFLFLPEGEDPDTLVGKEGRAAFEQRIAAALPLSEYLLAQLRDEIDLSHADGRARLVALARPLLAKLPAGIYHELLINRIAADIGMGGERLREQLDAPGRPGAGVSKRSAANEAEKTYMAGRGMQRGGRGGLLTQAIQMLLHFPAAAGRVPEELRAAVARLEIPGTAVLTELLRQQVEHSATSVAQTLERWRDRPEQERLAELARSEVLVTDLDAASRELNHTLTRLCEEARRQRMDELIARAREGQVEDHEKLELQVLIRELGPSPGDPG